MNDLPISGVNKNLKNTIYPFLYGNINQLKSLVKNKNIGIIKMEVQRDIKLDLNFLRQVRKIANENKIVLIFDECTSGFRANLEVYIKK